MRRKNIFDVYSYIPVDVRRSSIRVSVFMPSICVLKAIINAGMTLFSCCLSYHIIKTLKRSACMCVCENFCCHTDKQFDRKLDLGKKDKNCFRYYTMNLIIHVLFDETSVDFK